MTPESSPPDALIALLLATDASLETKARACRQLAITGDSDAVPVLASLLNDEKLSDYARTALEAIPGREAGDALRLSLPKLRGRLLAGAVNSLGIRRETTAVTDLTALLKDPGLALEAGVPATLALINTDEAIESIKRLLTCDHAGLRVAAIHSALSAARSLLETARRPAAKDLLGAITDATLPPFLKTVVDSLRDQSNHLTLFDGKTLTGWEGDGSWFKVRDGAIVAGSLDKPIPRNEFLATTREFGNFELRLQVRLTYDQGNGGIQFRSQRAPNSHEVVGYQADAAAGYWGGIYDESRRAKFLGERVKPEILARALKPGDWNDYRIRCEGPRIRLWLNDLPTTDFTEADPSIPQSGRIAVQIHAGPPAEASYRKLELTEL
jgi:hypothetical protein